METWSLSSPNLGKQQSVRSLNPIKIAGDRIEVVTAMPRDPFVLLGCSSGTVRLVALSSQSEALADEAGPIRALKLLSYKGNMGFVV